MFGNLSANTQLRSFAFWGWGRAAFRSGGNGCCRIARLCVISGRRGGGRGYLLLRTTENRNANRGCDYQADQFLHYILPIGVEHGAFRVSIFLADGAPASALARRKSRSAAPRWQRSNAVNLSFPAPLAKRTEVKS